MRGVNPIGLTGFELWNWLRQRPGLQLDAVHLPSGEVGVLWIERMAPDHACGIDSSMAPGECVVALAENVRWRDYECVDVHVRGY